MCPAAEPALSEPARLLIHARPMGEGPAGDDGWLTQRLASLSARLAAWRGRRMAQPALVQIDDLHGRRYFATDDASPCIDLTLPAGTYHVTVRVGALRRRYTVALEQGATVKLDLPLTQDHAPTRP